MQDYDVLIVGGGLAGFSCACHLKGKGLKVAVIERMSSERYGKYHRTCGEAVSNRMLDAAGV